MLLLACFLKRLPNPRWGSAAIQHPKNDCFALNDSIVDGIREAARQQALIPELGSVNSCIKHQRINFGKETVEKVISNAFLLLIIELPAAREILQGGSKDSNLHFSNRSRNCFFACSQS